MAKILLIDDEKSIRRSIKEILEFEKHQVEEAEDGQMGLNMALKNNYEVILSDIKMPKLDGIDLLDDNEDIALVGYSWEKKKFPTELFTPRIIGDFWEWYYSEKHKLNESLFVDEVEIKYLPEGYWVNYINWPYFGFRPAIHDIKKLKTIDNFNENMDSFELEFALRFAKKYKSFLHLERICYHIGIHNSSYNLNNSER
jgi:hypothetical protein